MPPLELENAIKELVVKEFGKEIPVTAFPDNLDTHKMLGNAEILLGYRGGSFDLPRHGTDAQMRTINFELIVISRSMSGHTGAVEILDRLRLALQGKQIFAASGGVNPLEAVRGRFGSASAFPAPQGVVFPIRIQKDAFLGRTTGQWWYSLEIVIAGIPALARPASEEPPIRRLAVKSETETLILGDSNG